MNVLVLGGDLRYLEIINNLSFKYDIDVVGYKNTYINDKVKNINICSVDISKYDIIIFPVNGVMDKNLINCRFNNVPIKLDNDLLVGTKENVLIFSGISTPALNNMLKLADRECTFLMKDDDIVKGNSLLTAEGIIADIIINTEKSLNNEDILVLGYGNIGKVLVKYLSLFNSNITVGIIDYNDKLLLDQLGINNFFTNDFSLLKESIGKADVIVNTVPNVIIDEKNYKYINKDSYILDISSHPHGFNQYSLDELFIKNKLYLGIPGKVAPITAGKILSKKITKVMEEKIQ
ncbi:MAG: hypothetical protein J6D28_00210 [Bacilli bacterium]|nr:hypothetical protein [Bacilli bacterium]